MTDETRTGNLTFTKVETKKSWWAFVKALGDFLASIGILLCFFWCVFCISTVDDRIKTLHQRIDTLKMVTDSKFEAASYRMDSIQEKLPPPILPREVSQFEPKRIGTKRGFYTSNGSSISEVAYMDGSDDTGNFVPKRLVVKTNFTGVVYVQRKNGSFEVVYP